jgi:hypothetical protein
MTYQQLVKGLVSLLSNDTEKIYRKKVHLTTAQVLTLDSAPELIAAPGVGKFIDVLSVLVIMHKAEYDAFNFGDARLTIVSSSSQPISTVLDFLNVTGGDISKKFPLNSEAADFLENTSILVQSGSGATEGEGSLDIYLAYRIVTL